MNRFFISILTVIALTVIADASTIKDKRDGKKYEVVKIGNQTWMAKNLNYAASGSFCYENNETYCRKYGRLYTWDAAQNACPDGWHLPNYEEFETLVKTVGGKDIAGKKLKSKKGWFWDDQNDKTGNGDDSFGFNALPAGYGSDDDEFYGDSSRTSFWSSTEDNGDDAFYVDMGFDFDNIEVESDEKILAISIRCILGKSKSASNELRKMRDSRDGKSYNTVKIGTQTWMAENLNYSVKPGKMSWCYDNKESNCDKYGRFYTWDVAFDVCPDGWHLPSKEEYQTLINVVGGEGVAGKKLKTTSGWIDDGNGVNSVGFSAIPSGYYSSEYGSYDLKGRYAFFLTATEEDKDNATYLVLGFGGEDVSIGSVGKKDGVPVRCVFGKKKNNSPSGGNILRDPRDGNIYKTVKIGRQTWMAENLNFSVKPGSQSWCYDNDESNCSEYGRLYTWAAAVGKTEKQCGPGMVCKLPNKVQGVCPTGWHLPSKEEFETLFNVVGGTDEASKNLKSQSGWLSSGNGDDSYGFAALPAGGYDSNGGSFDNDGRAAYFWTSTEFGSYPAYLMSLFNNVNGASLEDNSKDGGFSVRCVKN